VSGRRAINQCDLLVVTLNAFDINKNNQLVKEEYTKICGFYVDEAI